MNRHDARYFFEHRVLPKWFYEDKVQFVGMLLQDKKILFRIIDDIFKQGNVENPYNEGSFDILFSKVTDDVKLLKIIFPEPEEEPLCYCSYMFFNDDFEKINYFCIEKGNELSDYNPFVCSWSNDGIHNNYGNCTFDEHNDFIRCAEIFLRLNGYIE
ncbi:MAG: hypothetical protein IKS56_09700 [Lachnospiraceae bacterium]|nr:hypothetical protein [Lachnospiraceae bacterium]